MENYGFQRITTWPCLKKYVYPKNNDYLKKNRENDDKRGWMVIQPPITKYV